MANRIPTGSKVALGTGVTPARLPGDELPSVAIKCPRCNASRKMSDRESKSLVDYPLKRFCPRCLRHPSVRCLTMEEFKARYSIIRPEDILAQSLLDDIEGFVHLFDESGRP